MKIALSAMNVTIAAMLENTMFIDMKKIAPVLQLVKQS
jgi:hypothetical protein